MEDQRVTLLRKIEQYERLRQALVDERTRRELAKMIVEAQQKLAEIDRRS